MYLRNNVVGQCTKCVRDIFTSKLMLVFQISVQFELPIGHIIRVGKVSVCSHWVITLNKMSLNTLMTYQDLQ